MGLNVGLKEGFMRRWLTSIIYANIHTYFPIIATHERSNSVIIQVFPIKCSKNKREVMYPNTSKLTTMMLYPKWLLVIICEFILSSFYRQFDCKLL